MPIYEYDCPHCGPFQEMVDMSASAAPFPCPDCGTSSARFLSAPRLALLSAGQRDAHRRNEKSAHEPRRSSKHVCGAACSHGKPVSQKAGKRPWMLGH